MGLVVLGKDGEVQAIERQLELLGDELKGPSAGLLLGDAAKGEVAEHLKEGQVTAVLADAIDVVWCGRTSGRRSRRSPSWSSCPGSTP